MKTHYKTHIKSYKFDYNIDIEITSPLGFSICPDKQLLYSEKNTQEKNKSENDLLMSLLTQASCSSPTTKDRASRTSSNYSNIGDTFPLNNYNNNAGMDKDFLSGYVNALVQSSIQRQAQPPLMSHCSAGNWRELALLNNTSVGNMQNCNILSNLYMMAGLNNNLTSAPNLQLNSLIELAGMKGIKF